MNNEPVAWRCKKFYETQEGWFYNENQIGEPLYTHPANTLTDQEIMDCFKEVNLFTANMVDVARAILRKAQEK
jgi:hypothetical protein